MKFTEAMIVWTPKTSDVRVGPWPDKTGWSKGCRMSVGACFSETHAMSPEEIRFRVLADFHTIVVRDKVPVEVAHKAFLILDEYRGAISIDTPGADC